MYFFDSSKFFNVSLIFILKIFSTFFAFFTIHKSSKNCHFFRAFQFFHQSNMAKIILHFYINEISEDALEANSANSSSCTTYLISINDFNHIFVQICYLQHHFQVFELDSKRISEHLHKGPQNSQTFDCTTERKKAWTETYWLSSQPSHSWTMGWSLYEAATSQIPSMVPRLTNN